MTFREEHNLVVLQPSGHLDLSGGALLQQQIAAIAPEHHRLWVIDMAQVDFMDSSGLVALVSGLKTARQHHCRLVLCNLKTPVHLIFEITQLDRAFEIFETYEDITLSSGHRSSSHSARTPDLAVA